MWKETYKRIVREIRARHGGGDLPFLFAVAPINVQEAYRNVAEVVGELKAEGLNAWFYRYGFEVNGHPNRPESERMARELERVHPRQSVIVEPRAVTFQFLCSP